MPTPTVSMPVFYMSQYDIFVKPPLDPYSADPIAAIITGVNNDTPQTVNLFVIPNGRPPVSKKNVKYYADAVGDEEPRYRFTTDAEGRTFGFSSVDTVASDPVGYIYLYFTAPIGTGTIVYTDPAQTTPYIAREYIADITTNKTYQVDLTTGAITEI